MFSTIVATSASRAHEGTQRIVGSSSVTACNIQLILFYNFRPHDFSQHHKFHNNGFLKRRHYKLHDVHLIYINHALIALYLVSYTAWVYFWILKYYNHSSLNSVLCILLENQWNKMVFIADDRTSTSPLICDTSSMILLIM